MKQDNVLISETGVPLICEFGMFRMLAKPQAINGTTTSEKLRCSVRWLVVEFIANYQAMHTKETDAWAFGMMTYVSILLFLLGVRVASLASRSRDGCIMR